MGSKQASKRLQQEFIAMQKDPPPFAYARPDESDIFTWHYIIRGPPGTPYAGGEYYGVISFPTNYPFAPPGLKMYTPSGRFLPGMPICTSMSNFHPESWNPGWSCSSILTGLLSFMLTDEITHGGLQIPDPDRIRLATMSHAFNLTNRNFKSILPEYALPTVLPLPNMGTDTPSTSSSDTPLVPILPTSTTTETLPTPAAAQAVLPLEIKLVEEGETGGRSRLQYFAVALVLLISWIILQ